ncbi:MAG: DUF4097 family beta strand repeat-containing protein, partial [Lachnospiraceae bacterium]|nr:DUF4097 family beta strand repeat-containing protein [Lachnospiraceae bacterium]
LGSIEEFTEELNAFMTGKKGVAKRETIDAGEKREEAVDNASKDADGWEKDEKEIDAGTDSGQEVDTVNMQENRVDMGNPADGEDGRKEQLKQVDMELERARLEMNRAYEEMMHAKEELERAKMESERIAKEQAQRQRQAREQAEKEYFNTGSRERQNSDHHTHPRNQDFESIISSAKNIASSVINQVSSAMDKTFSGFGDWMGYFEKSGEDVTDYRRRQENAKSEAESYQRENAKSEAKSSPKERGMDGVEQEESEASKEAHSPKATCIIVGGEDWKGDVAAYHYDYEDADGCVEQYMPECRGIVTEEEGIRHIVVDNKSAEVKINPSEDNNFIYHYINEGSTGSRIVYRCEKKVSQGTLTISIVRDGKAGRKNHYSILGEVFEENADLSLELFIPSWVEALQVSGKSGDIQMRDLTVRTLLLKSMSGDITLSRVNSDKCMAETASGDVNVKDGNFGYILGASKSGDVQARNIKAEKAAFKTMSGDAEVQESQLNEAAVSSMSGDARTLNTRSQIISVSSMSGDGYIRGVSAGDMKVSAVSGDAEATEVTSDNLLMTSTSGDLLGNGIEVKVLKASATSGDMSIRGHADQMNITNGSGDVIVVQEGDTKASVSTRSGEVNFHLKNNGAGFASKVSTHGDTNYRYKELHLRDAANGIHRYGAQGSSLEIQSTSGDITITD